ncbi:hypothetical protein KUCAC02_020205 [Chaenocephalus aceratus]|uniref:Uncharacterized protein n=1 Tax=Chaenocephalus aceratus TaxID=36190 RepID=A0ACB9VRF4_CHAAC|nr:hypothetical protein KUCAC02_020205 [Chaenocephalus aceratus]
MASLVETEWDNPRGCKATLLQLTADGLEAMVVAHKCVCSTRTKHTHTKHTVIPPPALYVVCQEGNIKETLAEEPGVKRGPAEAACKVQGPRGVRRTSGPGEEGEPGKRDVVSRRARFGSTRKAVGLRSEMDLSSEVRVNKGDEGDPDERGWAPGAR